MTDFINYPAVKVSLNDEDLTPVPPEYLTDFVFEDNESGFFSFELGLHDPNYTDIENIFFSARRQSEVQMEFGYYNIPNQPVATTGLLRCYVSHYLPTFEAGMDIRITGYSAGAGKNIQYNEPIEFPKDTTISEAVIIIAKKIFGDGVDLRRVEETKEDIFVPSQTTEPKKPFDFIQSELVKLAKNKDGIGDYYFKDGRDGGGIRFSSPLFERDQVEIPTFSWLGGPGQSDVLSFTPSFNGATLGAWGAEGIKFRGWDATRKKWMTIPVNPTSMAREGKLNQFLARGGAIVPMPRSETQRRIGGAGTRFRDELVNLIADEFDRAVFGDAKINDTADEESLDTSITLPIEANNEETIRAIAENRWARLMNTITEAEITLNGSPSTIGIRAYDIIRVIVQFPNGQIHWSSGLWFVKQARHEIVTGTGYTVTCQLRRNSNALGANVVPEGVRFFEDTE